MQAEVQVFAVTCEVIFPRPKPFAKEPFDALALWLTDQVGGLALPPAQVRARLGDATFDYALTALLLGGNGSFELGAERAVLSIRGGRTQGDVAIIQETAIRFGQRLAGPEGLPIILSVNAHANLGSAEKREHFLDTFRPDPRVKGAGALGYVQAEGLADDVRFALEPSLERPGSVFLTWQTRFVPPADWSIFFGTLIEALGEAAGIYGLDLNSLME